MKAIAVVLIVVAFLAIVFCGPAQTNTQFLRINSKQNTQKLYLVKALIFLEKALFS